MNRMVIALFGNRAEADVLRQRLEQNGVQAEVHQRHPLARLWFVSRTSGPARVEVSGSQFDRAEELLDRWQDTPLLGNAIRCPECHSLRVDYPQYTRNSLLTNLVIGLLATIGFWEKDFYCKDCHFTWPKEGLHARRRRPHEAPYYFIDGAEQTRPPRPSSPGSPGDEQKREAA